MKSYTKRVAETARKKEKEFELKEVQGCADGTWEVES